MGIAFKVAAEAELAGDNEDVVEVPIEDVTYVARKPTTAQLAVFYASDNQFKAVFDLLGDMIGDDAVEHIKRLIHERRIDFSDLLGGSEENEDGLITQIINEFGTGRPTQPSTGSSATPTTGGRKSTRRAPGKGSTSSPSESTSS